MACPMPRVPPVTRKVLPERENRSVALAVMRSQFPFSRKMDPRTAYASQIARSPCDSFKSFQTGGHPLADDERLASSALRLTYLALIQLLRFRVALASLDQCARLSSRDRTVELSSQGIQQPRSSPGCFASPSN